MCLSEFPQSWLTSEEGTVEGEDHLNQLVCIWFSVSVSSVTSNARFQAGPEILAAVTKQNEKGQT